MWSSLWALSIVVSSSALQLPHVTAHAGLAAVRAPASCMSAQKDPKKKDDKQIGLSGLFQVMGMGAGAPMLGDLKEVNFKNDGKPDLMFELEANNFNLDDRGTYFDDGYVSDEQTAPNFFENLMSGGRLQREFDERKKGNK